jgi:hypothetical protein
MPKKISLKNLKGTNHTQMIQNIHSTMEIQSHMTTYYLMEYGKLSIICHIFMHNLNAYRVGHVLPSAVSLFLLRK